MDTSFRRRLFQIFIGLIVVLLLAVAGHYLTTHTAQVALQKQLEEYKRLGEPVTVADLDVPFVPDADNAALDYLSAAASVANIPESTEFDKVDFVLPWTNKESAAVKALLAKSEQALAHITLARTKTGVNWGVKMQSPAIKIFLPYISKARLAAKLAVASALDAHLRGDDALAMQRMDEIIFLSRAVDKSPNLLISHLVAIGIRALACDLALNIAAEINVPADGKKLNPASRKQITDMIALLLDEKSVRDGMQSALRGERVFVVDSITCMLNGTLDPSMLNPNLNVVVFQMQKAAMLEDARLMAIYITSVTAAAQSSDAPTVIANHQQPAVTSQAAKTLLPNFGRVSTTQFRILTHSRIAAVMLAMRLYAMEHNGNLPAKLGELVPTYLPAIPGDPMAAGSPPLKYIPNATDPIIYSVGTNFIDDGGSTKPSNARQKTVSPWEMLDAVFHYNRPPRDPSSVDPSLKDDPAK